MTVSGRLLSTIIHVVLNEVRISNDRHQTPVTAGNQWGWGRRVTDEYDASVTAGNRCEWGWGLHDTGQSKAGVTVGNGRAI